MLKLKRARYTKKCEYDLAIPKSEVSSCDRVVQLAVAFLFPFSSKFDVTDCFRRKLEMLDSS